MLNGPIFGWVKDHNEGGEECIYGKVRKSRSRIDLYGRPHKINPKDDGHAAGEKLYHTQPADHSSHPEHYEEKTSSSQGCAQKWDLQSKKFWYLAYKEKKAKALKWKKRAERSEKKLEEIRGKIKKIVDI